VKAARLSLMKRNNFMKKQRVVTHEEAKNHHSWRSEESSLNEEAKNHHSMQKRRLVKALDRSEKQLNNACETTLRSESDKNNIAKWIKQDNIAKSSQAKQSSQTRQHCKAKQTRLLSQKHQIFYACSRLSLLTADLVELSQVKFFMLIASYLTKHRSISCVYSNLSKRRLSLRLKCIKNQWTYSRILEDTLVKRLQQILQSQMLTADFIKQLILLHLCLESWSSESHADLNFFAFTIDLVNITCCWDRKWVKVKAIQRKLAITLLRHVKRSALNALFSQD